MDNIFATAPTPTLRALANGMRDAAQNLAYSVGTDASGRVVPLGVWRWNVGAAALPPLPPLTRTSSQREQRDHRYAERLRTQEPDKLLRSLLQLRDVIAEAVEGEQKLRTEYLGPQLEAQKKKLGERLLVGIGVAVVEASQSARRVLEVRRELGRMTLQANDADRLLTSLDLLGEDDAAGEADPGVETRAAVQTAVFDVAVAQALKPLSPADQQLVLEERALPDQLDDARVLGAIFRCPRPLLPFSEEELRCIARLSFVRFWPKTAAVAGVIDEMLEVVRGVAGQAGVMLGELMYSTNPYEAFRHIRGGLWAIEPLAETSAQAAAVRDDLAAYGGAS